LIFNQIFVTFITMKNWTDQAIKQQVEELIEESCLLSLSEHEIRIYIKNFVQTCESVLDERVDVHGDIKIIKVKIALLRVRILLDENILPEFNFNEPVDKNQMSSHDYLVQQVMCTKNLILRLLESVNPKLAQNVLEEFNRRNLENRLQKKQRIFLKKNAITIGFYLLFFLALTLVGVVLYILIGKI